MNKKYGHLSLEERERLYALREQEVSFREIASELRRHHTTLSREYGRHAKYGKRYLPCQAHGKAETTATRQRTKAPLKSPIVFVYVREKLRLGWSPETIAGRISLDLPEETIHHETIYRYIYSTKKTGGMKLWRYLALHRKKRMKHHGRKVQKTKIPEAVRIDQRPIEVAGRKVAGHWETDNMGGKVSDRQTLSGLVERKTRVVGFDLLADKTAETKTDSVANYLNAYPASLKQSLTADNGAENTDHRNITRKTITKVYFCFPYHSWEKGSIENVFKRVRRYIPKGTSLDTITQDQVKAIEYKLNTTPMKCLGYLTPYEKMREELETL